MAFTDEDVALGYADECAYSGVKGLRYGLAMIDDLNENGWHASKKSRFQIYLIKARQRPLVGSHLQDPVAVVLSALRARETLRSLRITLKVSHDTLSRILRDMRKAGLVIKSPRGWLVGESTADQSPLPTRIDANAWQDFNPQPRLRVCRRAKTMDEARLNAARAAAALGIPYEWSGTSTLQR